MKPAGVTASASRVRPLKPNRRRHAAGIVTRPRVENRTVKVLPGDFIATEAGLSRHGVRDTSKMLPIVRGLIVISSLISADACSGTDPEEVWYKRPRET